MKFLLDTALISELIKPRPEKKVLAWVGSVEDDLLALSVLTIGELHKGVAKLPPGPRRRKIARWIDEDLRLRFEGRVLPVTEEVASTWGRVSGEAEAGRRKRGAGRREGMRRSSKASACRSRLRHEA